MLETYFKNAPDGLPGNDDTGTMSAWAVFSMMGIYPIVPAEPIYALVTPTFDAVTIHLDQRYYTNQKVRIEKKETKDGNAKTWKVFVDGKQHKGHFISHDKLVNARRISFK